MKDDLEVILNKLEHRKTDRLEKDSETYKIMARVFDSSTLLALYRLINREVFDVFYGTISAGKEADIYCAIDKKGNFVAAKIYRIDTSNFKTMRRYLSGDSRFRRVPNDRRGVIYSWVSREFKNLQRADQAGISVPRPIDHEKNVLAMEFIGESGVPYPTMKNVKLQAPRKTFEKLFDVTKTLYQRAGLVHSDLSEYNVMLSPEPIIIDFSMATDVKNPSAHEMLMRDLSNLTRYFKKIGWKIPDPRLLFDKIIREESLT